MPTKARKTPARTAAAAKPQPRSKPKSPSPSRAAPRKSRPAMSPPPDIKALYLKFVTEVLNGGNFAVANSYLAPDAVMHHGLPGQLPGAEGFIAALKLFHGAFPDLNFKVTHSIAEGDLVVGRFEVTGTQRGSFLGMPPTHRKVHYDEIAIVRMAEGRIAEHWSVADALAILQQLGTSEGG